MIASQAPNRAAIEALVAAEVAKQMAKNQANGVESAVATNDHIVPVTPASVSNVDPVALQMMGLSVQTVQERVAAPEPAAAQPQQQIASVLQATSAPAVPANVEANPFGEPAFQSDDNCQTPAPAPANAVAAAPQDMNPFAVQEAFVPEQTVTRTTPPAAPTIASPDEAFGMPAQAVTETTTQPSADPFASAPADSFSMPASTRVAVENDPFQAAPASNTIAKSAPADPFGQPAPTNATDSPIDDAFAQPHAEPVSTQHTVAMIPEVQSNPFAETGMPQAPVFEEAFVAEEVALQKPVVQAAPDTEESLLAQLKEDDETRKIDALMKLADIGSNSDHVLDQIGDAVFDSSDVVQVHAAWTLGQITSQPEISAEDISDYLTSEQLSAVQSAAYLLGLLGDHATPYLKDLESELNHSDELTRLHVAEAVVKLSPDHPQGVATILDLASSEDDSIRCLATHVLSEVDPSKHPQTLVSLSMKLNDTDPTIRTAAALALGGFGLKAEPVIPALLLSTNDNDNEVRLAANTALSCIMDEVTQN